MSHDSRTLASVRYLVDDIPAALSFYTSNLGFEATLVAPPEIAVLRRGCLQLVLSGPASSAAMVGPDGRRPRPGGWSRIQLAVDDVENALRAAREAGAVIRSGPIQGKGGKQVVIDDPSGNPVEIFEIRG
jgi:catechol 2,3-dioxygenase-like lactoylglutathione lyase family enzyme